MKRALILSACIFFTLQSFAFQQVLKTYTLSDGEEVMGRLCMPDDGVFNTIVFAIHGTGKHTHLNMRKGAFNFNFYDELANGFCSRGVAFFSYDRRGITVDEHGAPPLFLKTDSIKYSKYTPQREAEDVENMLSALKSDDYLKNCKIILYGLSEGTIISAMVADRNIVNVDAIFLQGYPNENMYDIVTWQNQGHGVMIMARQFLDKDGDERISDKEYNEDSPVVKAYRNYLFGNKSFVELDVNQDGYITAEDIGAMRWEIHKNLMQAISRDDNQWIWSNYMELTSNWFKAHFALEPNKSRLLRLTMPIYIFHGAEDASVPVSGVYDIQERFEVSVKKNLTCHIFPGHNHDLNFEKWLTEKTWPEGMLKIFDTAFEISRAGI